jgi:ATP-dependent Lhr-like helicase
VLDTLALEADHGTLANNAIQCLYVSPLRALGYDLEKNLKAPLAEIYGSDPPLRVDLRSGDTKAADRTRQAHKPPHILCTTPESLCLLLSQQRWLPLLAGVRWLIVDEIHALAENKRGAHLSLSIERLSALVAESGSGHRMQRIGLSATVAPLDTVGRYLSGTHGACTVLDVSSEKRVELSVYTPLRKDPYPQAGYTGERLIHELGRVIAAHRTTLVFCNTRSGAEATTYWLRGRFPDLAEQIECHHASLEREVRRDVEDRLKAGELRAVVCSTSLELGIDIGSVDLVVMLSTPKGVSKALQRAGRAGHNIHSVSRGMLMATNVSDVVEACATVRLARQRQMDLVQMPSAPLDILAQHLVSMGCTRRWSLTSAYDLVRRSALYEHLSESDFADVLDYLAGGGASLRRQYADVFGKINLDESGFETKPGRVQREFLQNIGVIPNVGQVRIRAGARALGSVEEYFIRQLQVGDIFVLAGRSVRLDKVSQMEAWVTPADGHRPTVPRWNANKMPLSNRVAEEITAFRREIRDCIERGDDELSGWVATRLECGLTNARCVARIHAMQAQVSEIPTGDYVLVEEFLELEDPERHARPTPEPDRDSARPKRPRRSGRPLESVDHRARHYFFHTLIGRAANDAIARVVTLRLGRMREGGNAIATPHDYGFVLTIDPVRQIFQDDLDTLLDPVDFDTELDQSLAQSEMMKYHFRNAAQTGLMVYRNFFDQQKSVKKLHWSSEVIFNVLQRHEPNHVLMREARRETLTVFIDAPAAIAFLQGMRGKPHRLRPVKKVSPLSFPMYATKIKEALLVEDPFEVQERLYHQWWRELNPGEGEP